MQTSTQNTCSSAGLAREGTSASDCKSIKRDIRFLLFQVHFQSEIKDERAKAFLDNASVLKNPHYNISELHYSYLSTYTLISFIIIIMYYMY